MKEIFLAEYGILPGMDIWKRLNALFSESNTDTVFHFAPGEYHLHSASAAPFSVSLSNSDQLPVFKAGLKLDHMRSIKITGHGAKLLCHGQLSPIAIMDCTNITIEDLTIDFTPTHNAEGVILQATQEWADVAVDTTKYTYMIQDERLFFWNGETFAPTFGAIEFDAATLRTAYRAGDRFRSKRQEEISQGVLRFHGKFDPLPTPGNYITLRFSPRTHPGILVHHCEDVALSGITLHNTCGLGVLSQFSRDLRYTRITMRQNHEQGRRVVSCHDDGLHFSNNCGKITVEDCFFHGLMDDPVNVHGTALRIKTITGKRSLAAEFVHPQSTAFPYWAGAGDEVSFIEHKAMNSIGTLKAERYSLLSGNDCEVTFDSDLPAQLKPGDALENLSNTPQVEIRGCHFGSCRARGVLVSTPRKVVIENNVFESSGSAILIAGDANYWFETGACRDVVIRKNVFTEHCLTSMYQFCEGVISICPEIPAPKRDKPFHENIRIEDNTFHAFDAPLLYALSVNGLTFQNNTVQRSHAHAPWHPRKAMATLKACTGAQISGNLFSGDVLSTEVALEAF